MCQTAEVLKTSAVFPRKFGEDTFFQVGTLLKVNREDVDEEDFQLLLDSDIGVFIVEDSRLEKARQIIGELRGEAS